MIFFSDECFCLFRTAKLYRKTNILHQQSIFKRKLGHLIPMDHSTQLDELSKCPYVCMFPFYLNYGAETIFHLMDLLQTVESVASPQLSREGVYVSRVG